MPGGFNHYEQSLRIVDVLENDGEGLNLTWEVRDGIARHSKGKSGMPVGADPEHRASTIEGQIARVADIIAYVNHDIDDAVRAGLLRDEDLPAARVEVLGRSSSERIGRMVTDVVLETLAGGMTEIRMSQAVLDATVGLRASCSRPSTRTRSRRPSSRRPRGSSAASGRRSAKQPASSSTRGRSSAEGLDAAARDFLAGMTDRYAVSLYEQLFIPKPWVSLY